MLLLIRHYVRRHGDGTWAMEELALASMVSGALGFGAKALWDSYAGHRDSIRAESWKIRTSELERRLSKFYWPLYACLQRDNVIWEKVFFDLNPNSDSEKPEWARDLTKKEQGSLATIIEKNIIIPNHNDAVAIIRSNMHLANADAAFEKLLSDYVRHVDAYVSLRSLDARLNPIDVGEPYPEGFSQAVKERLEKYQAQYEDLLRDRGVLDLR